MGIPNVRQVLGGIGTSSGSDDADARPSFLGNELRYRREAAGLSQDGLAKQIPCSRSLVQGIERGRRTMAAEVADACDGLFGTDGLFGRLRKDHLRQKALWQSFLAWMEIEQRATRLRGYEPLLVPGLFQTRAYAAALMDHDEDAIAVRLERQELFARDNPPSVRYLLDECVLQRPVGAADLMVEQLERLLQIVDDRIATIQIVPSEAVPYYGGSFVLATVDDETLGYEETATRGIVSQRRPDVFDLEVAYDTLAAEALPASASIETIRRMKEQWTT